MLQNRRFLTVVPLLALLLVIGVAGCGSSQPQPAGSQAGPQFPLTISASAGPVKIAARPMSIVSLSPTATEMLYAIGAGPQVKAVDKYSNYPTNAPKKNLDGIQLNIEAITAYKPDLVITQDPSPADKKLTALGIPVLNEPAVANLDEAYQQFVQLGNATGHNTEAAAMVASVKSQVAEITSMTPKPARAATYYYELDPTFYSETSATFIGEMLKLFGLTSIADTAKGAAGGNGSPQLNNEFIISANPDYIFLADTVCCQQSAATVARRPAWAGLTAVKQARVVSLNDDIASRWGPRIVILLRTIADELQARPVG